MSKRALEGLIYDLLHKPLVKHEMTRIFYHNLMTPDLAQKAFDTVKRREALNFDFLESYLNFCARVGQTDKVIEGIAEANSIGIKPPKDEWHGVLATVHAHNENLLPAVENLTLARSHGVYDGRVHDAVVRLLCHYAKRRAFKKVEKDRIARLTAQKSRSKFVREDTQLVDELLTQALAFSRSLRGRKVFMYDRTHTLLVDILLFRGRYHEALEMAEWGEEIGYSTQIHEARFLAEASKGNLQGALNLKDRLEKRQYVHYSVLLTYCAQEGDLDVWLPIIHEVLQFYPRASVITFSQMIDILGSRGACKEMEEVFAALKRSGQEVNMLVYHTMVKHLTRQGEVARAIELLRELRPKGFDLDVPHNNVMQALHEREMWAQCDGLLAELRECNIVLGDRFDHYKCFLRMIPYWAARKETHERCTSYLLELEPAKAIHLFNEFLAQLAKRGDAISCISTMRVMRGHQIKPDVGSYCAMFRAATLAKLSTAQDVLLEEMLNDEVTEPNADLRLAMIRYFITVGNILACEVIVGDLCAKYDNSAPLSAEQKRELTEAMAELSTLKEKAKGGGEEKGEQREAAGRRPNNVQWEDTQPLQKKKGKLKKDEQSSGELNNSVT